VLVGLWCSMLAIYTLLFRYQRLKFIATLLVLWWDVGRAAWLFWAGMGKFVVLIFGAGWGVIRLLAAVIQELILTIFELPSQLGGNISRTFLQGGIPWIAVLMTVLWAVMEGLIFSYILAPTVSEMLSNLTGAESHRYLGVFLFSMLMPMILGSFACMHVLVDAVKARSIGSIIQMLFVEMLVMSFEVMFFYRELVDTLTPWISQQTGLQMGLLPVICIASFSWVGVRGMTWFLFARFGTPTLLAFISRQKMADEMAAVVSPAQTEARWDQALQKLKSEQGWFQERAQILFTAAVLPAFQLIAAAINFCVALFLSAPLFSLPFKSMDDIAETKALLAQMASWD